jgi:hypothetical protein
VRINIIPPPALDLAVNALENVVTCHPTDDKGNVNETMTDSENSKQLLLAVTAAAGATPPAAQALSALLALRQLRDQLDAWEPELIATARTAGVSWAELAPVLGVASRQAAERRYLRTRRPGREQAELTRDERVLAERDRRAGNRAVDAWAREHGADLRQLAGQVSALTGLGTDAQDSVDRVHEALGGNDLMQLMDLLIDAHQHLPAVLAQRVDALTEHSEQVRETTQRRRTQRRTGPAVPPPESPEPPGHPGAGPVRA